MTKEELSRKLVGNTTRFLKKNSTIILSVLAGIGVVATGVAVAKATPKAIKARKDAEKEKGSDLTRLEVVRAEASSYILPISIGIATEACLVSTAILGRKHEAALISACEAATTALTRYRTKNIELHGQKADDEIRDALAREYADFHIKGLDIPDQKAIWVDEVSGNTIVAYEREIMDAEYHMNRNFVMRGYAPLNEFYQFAGFPETKEGDALGWSSSDGYFWIDFQHRRIDNPDDHGAPMYAIDYMFAPDADYLREWESPSDYDVPWDEPIQEGEATNGAERLPLKQP